MKLPEDTSQSDPKISKCPFSGVMSHTGRVTLLFEGVMGRETPNVSVAWKWFQDEANLKKIREQKKPMWKDDGIDNRLAFAGLIGCIMPGFTSFIQAEAKDFFTMKEAKGYTARRFRTRMGKVKKTKKLHDDNELAKYDQKSREAFSLFLLDVFFLWRGLWGKEVSRMIGKNQEDPLLAWKIALDLCDDSPVQKGDRKKRGANTIRKEKKDLGIGQYLAGGMTTLASEFMRALDRQDRFAGRILANEEIEKILPRIHLGLLEIMREFTTFTTVSSRLEDKLLEIHPGLGIHERMRSGDISYSSDFFLFLQKNFMSMYHFLRKNDQLKKEIGTMTCPVTRSQIGGKNVVSILAEILIIPLLQKYYLPWRKKNIPGA